MDKQASTIRNMFSEIAPSYDKANTVLSLGIHHAWKEKMVKKSNVRSGDHVLDCATGTGDLALRFKKKVGSQGKVVGTDFCQEMIDLAPAKAKKMGLDVDFQLADACDLPFAENAFDCTSISFGIRNVVDLNLALKNLSRVTKASGTVMILEFGQIQVPGLKQAYNFYSKKVLPKLGGMISGNQKAYQYLNDSSQEFPCGQKFADLAMATGAYDRVDFWSLSLGVAYIYRLHPKA